MNSLFADRYAIRAELGRGSFGVVYLAHDRNLDREVALKTLHPALAVDPSTVKLFAREAGVLARLEHNNIVPVYDMGVNGDTRYIVMRRVSGRSLAQVLADAGPQPPARVAAWLAQIADGLDFAHSRGVLHRDLKPSNLLLDEARNQILISDFGLARAVENSGGSSSDQSRQSMTGTVLYMAPELLKGGGATPATDLYSLGCVLYELLTGAPPYIGDNPMAVMFQHVQADVPALDLPGTEGGALAAQVTALMAKEPGQRPGTAQAVVDALSSEPEPPPAPDAEPAPPPPLPDAVRETPEPDWARNARPPQQRGGMPVVAIVGFLALLTVLGFWLLGPASPFVEPADSVSVEPADPGAAGAGTVREFGGISFVYVPAGEFIMGSTDTEVDAALDLCNEFYGDCARDWFVYEQPQHRVNLDGYWIMQTEVTNAQYARCVDAGTCRAPNNERWEDVGYADHPVTDVSWDDGVAYAAWLSDETGRTIRLPTEAEWEKAARGTDSRTFPWGDTWDGTRLNYCDRSCTTDWKDESVDDGFAETAPVGTYRNGVSPYGALDMAGNVWEWTADCYADDYYAASPSRNPIGPECNDHRVVRGGSWYVNPDNVRAAYRNGDLPDDRAVNLGLRLASPGF